ncbi:MAG: hypothetical protein KF864_01530 [Phycisphaeraceae bacterium]|nr:hypothetical protein [Phycisphaeraceae bacterium]
MTKADLFRMLLVAADAPGSLFDHSEVSRWPEGALDELLKSHLVRPAQTGLTAPCPHCDDGHVESVTVVAPSDDTEKPRYFISCPELLKVEVTEEMCRGWSVDLDGLAVALASALGVSTPKPVAPGRFWRLGRMQLRETTREVVLAVRLADDDADALVRHVGMGGRAVVFVPHRVPDTGRWPGRVPAVIPMHDVAAMIDDNVVLDPGAVLEAIDAADRLAEVAGGVSLDARGKKLVRAQVKAEIKANLTDDILVAAYQEHNSIDKAAEALSEQMETKVSRDKVWRAVKRAEEAGVLARTEDSCSVSRSVASQRCDRGKKMDQYRK